MNYIALSEKVANLLKQPFSLELQNRVIDSFKNLYATRVRQSFERNGIDNSLKIYYRLDLIETSFPLDPRITMMRTVNKVAKPIRFENEAPFTFVGSGPLTFTYSTWERFRSSAFLFPNGFFGYIPLDGYLYLFSTVSDNNIKLKKIFIESIFYSPEDVITALTPEIDSLEVELPFAEDMINSIVAEMLKTEFGITNPDDNLSVKLNENETTVSKQR